MLTLFSIPNSSLGNTQIFYANGISWQSWLKPRGATMVQILCIGSGGGGGGGLSGTVASSRGGGGGGGSSTVTRISLKTAILPDLLYIQVGIGGVGGTAGIIGGISSASYVSVLPSITTANLILISQNNLSGGGAAGTSAGSNAGGAAQTAATAASMIISQLAPFTSVIGQAGSASGAITVNSGAIGVAVIALPSVTISGGAGGATVGIDNADFAGGAVTGSGVIPNIAGGLAGGGNGQDGIALQKPFVFCGGSGGGSAGFVGGIGGSGGNGAIGSGGGGGGAGETAGSGGNGGNGLVIITSW